MNVVNVSGEYSSTQTTRNTKGELGKDEFLKILVAQLQNQNPLSPMNDESFIAQMAQFSALEQMKSLNTSFSAGQAYNLIGRTVYAEIYDQNTSFTVPVYGKVDRVTKIGSEIYLHIAEMDIDVQLEDIVQVYDKEADQTV